MQSRDDKERKLKRNLETSLKRADESYRREHQVSETPETVREHHRREFVKAAEVVDKGKLPEMWNGSGVSRDTGKPHEIGYFGGVNFDDQGRIIRDGDNILQSND